MYAVTYAHSLTKEASLVKTCISTYPQPRIPGSLAVSITAKLKFQIQIQQIHSL